VAHPKKKQLHTRLVDQVIHLIKEFIPHKFAFLFGPLRLAPLDQHVAVYGRKAPHLSIVLFFRGSGTQCFYEGHFDHNSAFFFSLVTAKTVLFFRSIKWNSAFFFIHLFKRGIKNFEHREYIVYD